MLEPAALAEFRKNVAALDNRAIFEIPEILGQLLDAATTVEPRNETDRVECRGARRA
jgi:hypothetical protein